jgi:class 3 adenylate cyclase
VAKGWLSRAESLLEGEPESPSHGYLAIAHAELATGRGELDHAIAHIDRAFEIAERFGDRDLRAWASMRKGMVLVERGDVEEGWLHMEEVSVGAVGGEFGSYTTGAVFCNVISVCRDLADYARASEWADAAKRWCERQAIAGFPGVCRVHRAEVMRLIGAWAEAEAEVRLACEELFEFSPLHAGAAFHELGEVRLRVGDLAGAEEAFRQAHEMGEDPQPGQTLLLVARGKLDAAAASIRRSVEELAWKRLGRARLLPVQALVARATGDVEVARSAADELASIAEEFKTVAIRAGAEVARGIVCLMENDGEASVRHLRRGVQLWREVDAPYETASTSMLLAEAYLVEGDREAATMELRSARSTFERLGAAPDARRASDALADGAAADASSRQVQTFMFTDIAGSTSLIEAIGDEAWERLRRWHDETLRRCFSEHAGEEIDHAGDGFFVAFPEAGSAVTCAVEIQRKLAEHREEHGFAPQVRIGVHAAEATRAGGEFSGRGVHAAARIGALADGGEILASHTTIVGMNLIASEPREVSLKGIAEPVRVVAVEWRSA